jgi:hypothetical protein
MGGSTKVLDRMRRRRAPGASADADVLARLDALERTLEEHRAASVSAVEVSHHATWANANDRHVALDALVREVAGKLERAVVAIEASVRGLGPPIERARDEIAFDYQATVEALVYATRTLQEVRASLDALAATPPVLGATSG